MTSDNEVPVGALRLRDIEIFARACGEEKTIKCAVTVDQNGTFRVIPEGRMTAVEAKSLHEARIQISEKAKKSMEASANRRKADWTGCEGFIVQWNAEKDTHEVFEVRVRGVQTPEDSGTTYNRRLLWEDLKGQPVHVREREPKVWIDREDALIAAEAMDMQAKAIKARQEMERRAVECGYVGNSYGALGRTNAKAADELRKRFEKVKAAKQPQEGSAA